MVPDANPLIQTTLNGSGGHLSSGFKRVSYSLCMWLSQVIHRVLSLAGDGLGVACQAVTQQSLCLR